MRQELQWKVVDNWKRHLFLKYELKRKLLKALKVNNNIPLIYRQYIIYKLTMLSSNVSLNKHVNRCVLTGRTWMVIKKFRLSRFMIREKGYYGLLPGFRRISW